MARVPRVPLEHLEVGLRTLKASQAHYLSRVRRVGPGEVFTVFDPEACLEAEARVVEAGKRRVVCEIAEPTAARVPGARVTLLQGIGKGDKADRVVRYATALGASRLVFIDCRRSVPKVRDERARHERWRTVAIETARQCGRGNLPDVAGPLSMSEALSAIGGGIRICLSPDSSVSLATALRGVGVSDPVTVLVGPEGGLDDAELNEAVGAGFVRAHLGEFVLRTELAAAAALGTIAAQH